MAPLLKYVRALPNRQPPALPVGPPSAAAGRGGAIEEEAWSAWVRALQSAARAANAAAAAANAVPNAALSTADAPPTTHVLGLRRCLVCRTALGTPHHMRAHVEGRRHCEAVARSHLLCAEAEGGQDAPLPPTAEGISTDAAEAMAAAVFERHSSAVLRASTPEPPDVALAALQQAFKGQVDGHAKTT